MSNQGLHGQNEVCIIQQWLFWPRCIAWLKDGMVKCHDAALGEFPVVPIAFSENPDPRKFDPEGTGYLERDQLQAINGWKGGEA